MQFKEPGTDGMSRSQPIIQTLDRMDARFPGGSVPAMVVVKAKDVTTPEVQASIKQLHDKAIATGQLEPWASRSTRPRPYRRGLPRRQGLGHGFGLQPFD